MRQLTERQKLFLRLCKNAQSVQDLCRKMSVNSSYVHKTAYSLIQKELLRKDKMSDGSITLIATQKTWPPKRPTKPTKWDGPIVCGVRL